MKTSPVEILQFLKSLGVNVMVKKIYSFSFTSCFLLLTDQPVKGLLDLALGKGGDKRGRRNHMHFLFAKNPCSLSALLCSPDEMKHLGPICLVNIKVPFH